MQVHTPPTIFTTSYETEFTYNLSKGKPRNDCDVIKVRDLVIAVTSSLHREISIRSHYPRTTSGWYFYHGECIKRLSFAKK